MRQRSNAIREKRWLLRDGIRVVAHLEMRQGARIILKSKEDCVG
jgi:hypothetical protein